MTPAFAYLRTSSATNVGAVAEAIGYIVLAIAMIGAINLALGVCVFFLVAPFAWFGFWGGLGTLALMFAVGRTVTYLWEKYV
jgi:hypothetical protein